MLSQAQIENWRRALIPVYGTYALMMSNSDIQALHDAVQERIDNNEPSDSEGSDTQNVEAKGDQ